ncbi:MAG: hypothetical protein R2727_05460 [Bacteroidales bacterium]
MKFATRRVVLYETGSELGKISRALENFDSDALKREFDWGLRRFPEIVEKRISLIRTGHFPVL